LNTTGQNASNLLITGSSGYIGKHLAHYLITKGHKVIGVDVNALPESMFASKNFVFYQGDFSDKNLMNFVIKEQNILGIFHLAGLKSVEESMENPELYERINKVGTRLLLDAAITGGVRYFVLSSTAAVYGPSKEGVLSEDSLIQPSSPYGQTKFDAEKELLSSILGGKIQGVALRYFNVLGAFSDEFKDASTSNILPKVLDCIRTGNPPVIFGDDYDTPDGTAVRDYIHVLDVVRAHYLTLNAVISGEVPLALNIGTGKGYSVREIIDEIILQTHSAIAPVVRDRRAGDVGKVVADVSLAKSEIGFEAEYDLRAMIKSSL
jgi:UDP-glucose 4-epimerase